MKTIKYISIFVLLLAVISCTSVMVLPQTGNMSTIIAESNNADQSVKVATTRARHTCETQNQILNIIDLKTIYQGSETDQQDLIKLAKNILPINKTSGSYTAGDYDYKSTITFKCK